MVLEELLSPTVEFLSKHFPPSTGFILIAVDLSQLKGIGDSLEPVVASNLDPRLGHELLKCLADQAMPKPIPSPSPKIFQPG